MRPQARHTLPANSPSARLQTQLCRPLIHSISHLPENKEPCSRLITVTQTHSLTLVARETGMASACEGVDIGSRGGGRLRLGFRSLSPSLASRCFFGQSLLILETRGPRLSKRPGVHKSTLASDAWPVIAADFAPTRIARPVAASFYKPWCWPCQRKAVILRQRRHKTPTPGAGRRNRGAGS